MNETRSATVASRCAPSAHGFHSAVDARRLSDVIAHRTKLKDMSNGACWFIESSASKDEADTWNVEGRR